MKLKPKPDEEEIYRPFMRLDIKYWRYYKVFLTQWLFWPRNLVGWNWFWSGLIFVNLITMCHKKGTPYRQW
jgi:hypothetical protein